MKTKSESQGGLACTGVWMLLLTLWAVAVPAADFPPISEQQKALTRVPSEPNAPAVVLFRKGVFLMEYRGKESESIFTVRARIKILTEEGKRYGEVKLCNIATSNLRLAEISKIAIYIGQNPFSTITGLTVGQEMAILTYGNIELARECLNSLGIGHLWDRETTRLSGGETVRLILAGVLARRAPVLLLDEPLDQLDEVGRQQFILSLQEQV